MYDSAVIESVAHYLPDTIVTSEDVERRVYACTGFRIGRGLIARLTGVERRRFRAADEQTSDMAVQAARAALHRAKLSPADVDLIVFASCTQDLTEPATGNIVQEKLGALNAHVFDIKNACNSFLNGLYAAEGLIRAGRSRTALVCVGETPSLSINWHVDSAEKLRRCIAGLTLGDAGGAAILRAERPPEPRGVLTSAFRTIGNKWRLATVLAGGSMHGFRPRFGHFHGNPLALREQALTHVPSVVETVLRGAGWTADEVDVVCCHQVTADLVESLAVRCGLEFSKCIMSVQECGNVAAASIPVGLSMACEAGRLHRGAKVLLVGAAAGFSAGATALIW